MNRTVLRIDASARRIGSVSRELADRIVEGLDANRLIVRDLAETPVPQIDEAWISANFTPPEERSKEQQSVLALSDSLVGELVEADTIVIGVPIYNFGVPAALKAWVDQVARAGVTFRYTEAGPRGLLEGKRAVVVVASGGTESGSEIDFATQYVRHVLGFLGITDVDVVAADRLMIDADATMRSAKAQIEALGLAA